jgi:hypothetical protein
MSYTVDVTESLRLSEADAGGLQPRTIAHHLATCRLLAGTQQLSQLWTLSANVTDRALPLDPVSVAQVLWLQTDQACDLLLGSAARLSGVRSLLLAGVVSAVAVTTGSATTVMRVLVCGGGSLVVSIPTP